MWGQAQTQGLPPFPPTRLVNCLHLQARFSWLSVYLLLCFRATNTCLLALEPPTSSTPGVVVAFIQVVPGVGHRPGACGPGGWGGHPSPGEPHGRRRGRGRVPGATAELPPDWSPSRGRGGAAAVLNTPRMPLHGMYLWPESLQLLPRPAQLAQGAVYVLTAPALASGVLYEAGECP